LSPVWSRNSKPSEIEIGDSQRLRTKIPAAVGLEDNLVPASLLAVTFVLSLAKAIAVGAAQMFRGNGNSSKICQS
jgi:hypothetical protein